MAVTTYEEVARVEEHVWFFRANDWRIKPSKPIIDQYLEATTVPGNHKQPKSKGSLLIMSSKPRMEYLRIL